VIAVIILASGSGSPSGAPTWTAVTSLPTPLEGSGVAAYRGQLWIAGGCSNPSGGGCAHSHDVKLVYHYNPQTGRWQPGPSLPAALNHPAMASDGAHLYVIGGFGADGQAVGSVFRLDSPSGTWQTDARSLPAPRGAGAAAWDGKRIVFAGGAEGGGTPVRGDVWALATNQWTAIGPLQQPRKHLAAASDGHGTVWFVGGKDAAGSPSPLVDVVSGHAVMPGQPVTAVTGNAAVGVGSGFCTLTGATHEGVTGAVQCQPSRSLQALDPPRDYVGAAVLDGKVYVVGGFDTSHKGGLRTVESLDIAHAQ
jgi:N-acetylneuraminic acid mutarotase